LVACLVWPGATDFALVAGFVWPRAPDLALVVCLTSLGTVVERLPAADPDWR
jgi:hypothetical protein